jgi:hypothetical protein
LDRKVQEVRAVFGLEDVGAVLAAAVASTEKVGIASDEYVKIFAGILGAGVGLMGRPLWDWFVRKEESESELTSLLVKHLMLTSDSSIAKLAELSAKLDEIYGGIQDVLDRLD